DEVGWRDEHDRERDEYAENRAQAEGQRRRAAKRRGPLRKSRMVGRGNIVLVLRQLGIERVPDRAVAGSRRGAYFGVLVVAEQRLLERFPHRQVVIVRLR